MEVYTSNGELDDDYIVTAKMKFIGTFKEKDGTIKTIIDYDSTADEINEETVRELIVFCSKAFYKDYKKGKR